MIFPLAKDARRLPSIFVIAPRCASFPGGRGETVTVINLVQLRMSAPSGTYSKDMVRLLGPKAAQRKSEQPKALATGRKKLPNWISIGRSLPPSWPGGISG